MQHVVFILALVVIKKKLRLGSKLKLFIIIAGNGETSNKNINYCHEKYTNNNVIVDSFCVCMV